jgi:starch-binding outer membrane protein, SusD/RagB family
MNIMTKRSMGMALAAAVVSTTPACGDLLDVRNPGIVDAATVDPVENAETFSRSALQSFARAYGEHIIYSAWFTNEMWVGDTFPTRNEFGMRSVDDRNGTYNNDVYQPLAQGLAQSETAADVAQDANSPIDLARSRLSAGFSLVLMGEMYCQGVITGGPALSTGETLTQAVGRFDEAIGAAQGLTGAEATNYNFAAHVGAARAHLQMGNYEQAISYATPVPAEFEYALPYVDQADSRTRLGNNVFFYSRGGAREAFVVPPHYREMGTEFSGIGGELVEAGDPRIPFWDTGAFPQDGTLPFFSQLKYPSWASAIRLASGLEARYIIAEAELHQGNPASALLLINERREAGGQGAFVGTGDAVLAELMDQRSRDFWIEGKRMGDWRRNMGAVPNILQEGDSYYKAVQDGIVRGQTCWPMPFQEYNANENIPAP